MHKTMIWKLICIIGFFGTVTLSKTADIQYHCPSHNPQKSLDMKRLMGQWFIVEVVQHLPTSNGGNYDTRELNIDACPSLHLVQDDFNNIRLKWNENDIDLYYHAKWTDSKALGFWIASGPNKEPFLDRHSFHFQYSGTIEVMKAVGNHAVLTFCKSDHTDSQLFSVVIARKPWLSRADTRSVNSMLQSRGLETFLIKRTCNSAGKHFLTASLALLVLFRFFM